MTNSSEVSNVDDIINEYASLPGGPSHAALLQWIKRYPKFKEELTEFTVAWALQDGLPPAKDAEVVDTETLVLRGMSVVEDLLHQKENLADAREGASPTPEIESLMAAGRDLNLGLHAMATGCDLSLALMAKLNRRLIELSSIPGQLVQQLAKSLEVSPASLKAYFQRPIALADGARYRSSTRPAPPAAKENFFEAVRMDPSLSESQRVRWLTLQPESEL